jgi:hypothetical protein
MPLKNLALTPVWFDSLGAKSACTLVKTPDTSVLIDPGIAVMHPSFPASQGEKMAWFRKGREAIKKAAREAEVVVISHYHYDHFIDFDRELYRNKLLLAKNPNYFINDSQRKRAERFYDNLCRCFGETRLGSILCEAEKREYGDPMESLPLARSRDFKDYATRKRELLEKGGKWFRDRVEKWREYGVIPEVKFSEIEVKYPEGREFIFKNTRLRFTEAFFHGIEYSRVGWIFATVVEYGGEKLIHSSDMNGPIIEDYARWIIQEDPNVLILDGPMTYMLGYLLNRINLSRAVENACRIAQETRRTELIIYDHHLPREPGFRERTKDFWDLAKGEGKTALTAAEYLGKPPAVLAR